ncbi:MAG: DUF2459 domain-containing protein [Planctomycetota bacterium]|jgi:hypothetical protein
MMAAVYCLTGCTASIITPHDLPDPVSVFVLDYGRHSSLALPTTDEAALVEYAYGDWNWFALDKSEWHDALPTLFWPTRGALGRRSVDVEPTPASVLQFVRCEEVLEIRVSGRCVSGLATELNSQFDSSIDTAHYQPLYDLTFVHSDRSFHLFHNCNHAVADWLRKVDCQVRGPTFRADFVVRPARGSAESRLRDSTAQRDHP